MQKTFNKKKIYFILALFILLVFLHYLNALKPIEKTIIGGINKGGEVFYNLGSNWKPSFKGSQEERNLKENNENLQIQVNELLAEKAKWQEVERENDKLRNYLNFFEDNEYNKVMARVVASDNLLSQNANQSNIYLNKGSEDGLREGMAVINEEGILVGKILSLHDNSAQVCLSINEDCKFAARFSEQSEAQGVVQGSLGLTISMNLIPQEYDINIGDLVVSSGLEKNIPPGLIIGEVSSVSKQSNDIWQEAIIEPLYNLNKIDFLAVLTL
ncbi:MAG TPA: rod shape-determining protein MreC [Patescibacteria group bacterium]|nr:rod shape-determining protein MreC [Patescibacteria group bacterium]